MALANGLIFKIMKYKEELIRSMNWLGEKNDVIFTGQAVKFSGHSISSTLLEIKEEKKIELPVFEEMQMGMAMGLGLLGYVPVTIYPRFDFFILALNQLVNHLDKLKEMSNGNMKSKVIIRVAVGSKIPFSAGPQHTQDYSESIKLMLKDINIVKLENVKDIFPEFKKAYERKDGKSTLLIEYTDYYGTK